MKKSTQVRVIIFEILIDIYKKNMKFDDLFNLVLKKYKLNELEKSFIFNVCLNTMRYSIHSKKILDRFIKKKLNTRQYILLSSAITQLVFLNVKAYAVINETVEVAKKIKLYPSFINAILKKINDDIKVLKKIKINKEDFPIWFTKHINDCDNINLDLFFKTYFFEPSLHLVFKSNKFLNNFDENYILTSPKSIFLKKEKKINELDNYTKGHWWVQNFSSMLPMMLAPDIKDKDVLDLCAAPGGKAFQILADNNNVMLNDISIKRIKTLKENLNRLKYHPEVKNYNALDFPERKKFDVVLIDAPCSAVGTLRTNPEIIFKQKSPNLNDFFEFQIKLLNKSAKLVKPGGIIIYMVCSFLYIETLKPINNFLKYNNEFRILSYENLPAKLNIKKLISEKGYFITAPTIYKNFNIDGFFSIQLIKNV